MHNQFRRRSIKWIGFICAVLIAGFTITHTKAGTILLMGIGLGTPGGGGGGCAGAADLSDGCALTSSLGIR